MVVWTIHYIDKSLSEALFWWLPLDFNAIEEIFLSPFWEKKNHLNRRNIEKVRAIYRKSVHFGCLIKNPTFKCSPHTLGWLKNQRDTKNIVFLLQIKDFV